MLGILYSYHHFAKYSVIQVFNFVNILYAVDLAYFNITLTEVINSKISFFPRVSEFHHNYYFREKMYISVCESVVEITFLKITL